MPIFTTQDPLAEKYYSINPYAYCAGNPIKYIDPDGKQPFGSRGLLPINPKVVLKQAKEIARGTANSVFTIVGAVQISAGTPFIENGKHPDWAVPFQWAKDDKLEQQHSWMQDKLSWEDASLMANTNRYIFSGKEKQTIRDLGWLDFSARMYANCEMPIFTTQDPLAEKYYSISPYAYCFNNPIKYIDPTGMYIEESSQREWDRQRNSVTRERDKLQNKVDNFTAKAEAKGWSAEKLASKIGNSADRVSSLNNTIVQN
jgi:RHS repeat-associated protein